MSNHRTPLYPWHAAHNARMVPFGGWEMPVQYAGIVAEHKAVRSGAGVFDISHMGRLDFAGPDALKLLETVFTNSVATMTDGQVRYGLVCRDDGGILDDILVYRWATGFAAVVNASNREKIVAWLTSPDRNLTPRPPSLQGKGESVTPPRTGEGPGEGFRPAGLDVQITDQTLATAMVAVQGPKAVEVCAGLFADDASGLKYYHAAHTQYRDQPCVVSRTGYTGEDGFEVIVPDLQAVALWDDLIGRGAVPCGLGARDTLRLEAAMPLYGHELTEAIDPIRAGLGWAVKPDKGEFVGRDAVRAASAKANTFPRRVGLEVEGKRAAREGCPILTPDNAPAGTVTSGSFCPGVEKSLAMGYVDPASASPGTKLLVDVRGTLIPAVVVPLPFYKRAKREN